MPNSRRPLSLQPVVIILPLLFSSLSRGSRWTPNATSGRSRYHVKPAVWWLVAEEEEEEVVVVVGC